MCFIFEYKLYMHHVVFLESLFLTCFCMCYFLCYSSSYGFNVYLCDVFLFVITIPDYFSICIGWITLYMFSKRI